MPDTLVLCSTSTVQMHYVLKRKNKAGKGTTKSCGTGVF